MACEVVSEVMFEIRDLDYKFSHLSLASNFFNGLNETSIRDEIRSVDFTATIVPLIKMEPYWHAQVALSMLQLTVS